MKKRIRIQGILIVFSIITIFLLYKFLFPHWKDEKIETAFDVLGIGLMSAGFLFRISARGYKEEKSLSSKALVMDGPYAVVRNPMYFGTLMIGVGFITVLVEWWALLVFLLAFFIIYIPQVKREESLLAERFGQEYKDYSRKIPRFFPKINSILALRKYLPLKLSWIKKESMSLVAIITCTIVIETWEDVTLFGRQELFNEPLGLALAIAAFASIITLLFTIKKKNGTTT